MPLRCSTPPTQIAHLSALNQEIKEIKGLGKQDLVEYVNLGGREEDEAGRGLEEHVGTHGQRQCNV